MSNRWVLVDGYSVLHAWPHLRRVAGRSLEQQRDALVAVLRRYADSSGRRVTVVFDGYAAKRKPAVTERVAGIEVIFSEHGKTADDVIERLVAEAPQPEQIQVVTSDNLERHTVESLGAQSISTELFELEVGAAARDLDKLVREHGRRHGLGTVRHRLDG
jgi:predicted RNA-binding protein with PIN domain